MMERQAASQPFCKRVPEARRVCLSRRDSLYVHLVFGCRCSAGTVLLFLLLFLRAKVTRTPSVFEKEQTLSV